MRRLFLTNGTHTNTLKALSQVHFGDLDLGCPGTSNPNETAATSVVCIFHQTQRQTHGLHSSRLSSTPIWEPEFCTSIFHCARQIEAYPGTIKKTWFCAVNVQAQHQKTQSCSVLHMAKKLLLRDHMAITPGWVAQWTGLGEAGPKIFPKFQTANDIFF